MAEEEPDLPARRGGGQAAPPDGGRRAVVVAPEEVWPPPRPAAAAPPPELAPLALRRDARRSFMGPVVLVVALSTALMALFLLALALLWWRAAR